jgi:hypothetical protein
MKEIVLAVPYAMTQFLSARRLGGWSSPGLDMTVRFRSGIETEAGCGVMEYIFIANKK